MHSIRLWTAVHQTYQTVMDRSKILFKSYNLSEVEYLILFHAGALNEFPQAKFAKLLNVSKAAVTLALRSLQLKGFLTVKTRPDDQRHKTVCLSKSGEQLIRKLFAERAVLIKEMFSVYDTPAQVNLFGELSKFHEGCARYASVLDELESLEKFYFPAK